MYGTEDRGNEKSACAFFFKWGCFLGGVFGGFLFFQDGVFGGGGGLVLAKFVRLFVCSLAFAWGWVGKSALRDVARKDECCWSAAGYGSYLPSRDDGLATHLTLFKPSPTPPINPSPKVTPPPSSSSSSSSYPHTPPPSFRPTPSSSLSTAFLHGTPSLPPHPVHTTPATKSFQKHTSRHTHDQRLRQAQENLSRNGRCFKPWLDAVNRTRFH